MPSSINPEHSLDSTDGLEAVARWIDRVRSADDDDFPVEMLSDLDRPAAQLLAEEWQTIPPDRRLALVQAMVADAEEHLHRQYARALRAALDDPDAEVRLASMDGLWEDESEEFKQLLLERIERELDPRVRASMAQALGRFAFDADPDDDSSESFKRLYDTLSRLHDDDPSEEVQRRALESLGYFGGTPGVIDRIEAAYSEGSFPMRVSALHAMGRQSDVRWLAICSEELSSDDPELRFEAVTALGSIGDERAVSGVIDALADDDTEVRLAAIAALGSIGGQIAVNALRRLANEDDPATVNAAEDALEEALLHTSPVRPLM